MFGSSMVLTVGHALDRAREQGLPVRLNVSGEWITGRVLNQDGHGVAVMETNGDMCILRPEAINGVRFPRGTHAGHAESRLPLQQHEPDLVG
jgi:hypothetical protein